MLTIRITESNGAVKASEQGERFVSLVHAAAYEEGDVISLEVTKPCFVTAWLEDSLSPTFGWLAGTFILPVPFAEKRASYSPKCFTGNMHLLQARIADKNEIENYRNLAWNPLDSHRNQDFFPHASANVETRGESVFAARNAINGNVESRSHGIWPYESWGINRQKDAEIRIDFGREVLVRTAVITLRADFPHDNWWTQATFRFSDGSSYVPHFAKTGEPQSFDLGERRVSWCAMGEMIASEEPSPFPALTQIELWGRHIV